jgi:hypothetical protein
MIYSYSVSLNTKDEYFNDTVKSVKIGITATTGSYTTSSNHVFNLPDIDLTLNGVFEDYSSLTEDKIISWVTGSGTQHDTLLQDLKVKLNKDMETAISGSNLPWS